MCKRSDFDWMELTPLSRQYLDDELEEWHRDYLPVPTGVVLDVGAGCGETAYFYLRHGATQVICVERYEPAYDLLCRNFAAQIRTGVVIPICAHLTKVKIDIEGGEENMDLEVHFPHAWQLRNTKNNGQISQYRLRNLTRDSLPSNG